MILIFTVIGIYLGIIVWGLHRGWYIENKDSKFLKKHGIPTIVWIVFIFYIFSAIMSVIS